jgi:hypothetical protein
MCILFIKIKKKNNLSPKINISLIMIAALDNNQVTVIKFIKGACVPD